VRRAFLSLLTIACLLLLAVAPATADTLWDNGPYNGTVDAWTINNGFSVSDSFTLQGFSAYIEGFHMVNWNLPGFVTTGAEIQFGGSSFGTNYADLTVAPSGSTDLGSNQFGYELWQYDFTFAAVQVPSGTSWVTLSNATDSGGNPVYWDENSGPSSAYENTVGSIASEAFTLTANTCGDGGPDCGPPVPEPSSLMLFGSGILAVVGVLRRKLNR
jgi:hypothetical protein